MTRFDRAVGTQASAYVSIYRMRHPLTSSQRQYAKLAKAALSLRCDCLHRYHAGSAQGLYNAEIYDGLSWPENGKILVYLGRPLDPERRTFRGEVNTFSEAGA